MATHVAARAPWLLATRRGVMAGVSSDAMPEIQLLAAKAWTRGTRTPPLGRKPSSRKATNRLTSAPATAARDQLRRSPSAPSDTRAMADSRIRPPIEFSNRSSTGRRAPMMAPSVTTLTVTATADPQRMPSSAQVPIPSDRRR